MKKIFLILLSFISGALFVYYVGNDFTLLKNKIITPFDNKSVSINFWDDGFVEAKGTLAYKKNEYDINIAFPEQTSKITCIKDFRYCSMYTAKIIDFGNDKYLTLDDYAFELISWDNYQIIAKKDYSCAREIIKINRENAEVVMDRTYINKESEECKNFATDSDKQFTIILRDGQAVAQELKNKPRN